MTDTLDILHSKLRIDGHRWPDRHGEYHADCPFCGKPAMKGQTHFSLFAHNNSFAYKCHVCGAGGGLVVLLRHLEIDAPANAALRTVRPQEPPKPRQWQRNPDRWLDGFLGAPERLRAWQAYKPLSLESISQWKLGIGVLPSSRCRHKRLIVPVFDQGQVVAFHGRAYLPGDDDAKWLTAGGSRKDVLFGAECLRPGRVVVIVENMVDAILLMQQRPAWVAVASGGVGWSDAFTQQVIAARPASVIVWLDNDLAGCPNEQTYGALLTAWHAEQQRLVAAGIIPRVPREPFPRGPRIIESFRQHKYKAIQPYRWPVGTPYRADIGTLLQQETTHAH